MQLDFRNLRWTRCLGLLCLLCMLVGSRPAHADDFKTRYDLALALYQAQRFDDSIPEFKAAYDLIPKPGLLFNIAQAYRKAGHPREAIEYYDRYLSAEPELDGDTRHKVDSYLMEARNTLAALELEMKRRLAEEKAARENEAPPSRVETPPPVSLQPVTQSVTPVQPAPAAEQKPVYKRWWFWTAIGGAAVVGIVVGVTVGVVTRPQMPTVGSDVPLGTITLMR